MIIKDHRIIEKVIKPDKIANLYYFKPIKGFSLNSRTINPGEAFIAIKGAHKDGHEFIAEAVHKGAHAVIAEHDVPERPKVPFYFVKDSYDALKHAASYVRRKKNPFVFAITGSVGKTTTKEMLSFLLEKDYKLIKNYKTENNILGLSKTIFSLSDEEVLIVELGTNAQGEIEMLAKIAHPDVGIITFIKPAHLERLGGLRGILQEKTSLFVANPHMQAVLNRDDRYLRSARVPKKVYWFGKDARSDLSGRLIKRTDKTSTFLVQGKFPLVLATPFSGFIYNALASLLAARLLNIELEYLIERLNCFSDYPYQRMEIKEQAGLLILSDAYNANPFSFQEALKMMQKFPQKKIAVIGDMLELGDRSAYYHRRLATQIIKAGFQYCFTIGNDTLHLVNQLHNYGYRNASCFLSHEAIAEGIRKKARKGWLIFLKGSRKMELEKILTLLG